MIKRYECFTGHKHHEATVTDDGPWVSYTDHAKEIATLRAKVTELSDEAYDYAEQLQAAERERDTLRADVERRVKEIAYLKLAAEKVEREEQEDE